MLTRLIYWFFIGLIMAMCVYLLLTSTRQPLF